MTLLAGASLFMAGCSSEDVSGGEQSQRIWKAIVPGAVKGDVAEAGDGTRALFVGGHTNRYGALWDDGDVVQVYRQNGTKVDGQLTPDESSWGTKSATLNGTLTGSFAVEEQLTLYQPSKTMDFTGQKGTLQTASDKTYQTGTVTVESAQENTLTLSNVQLQYLNYYVRFLLSDDDTKERLHPSSLTLHAASGGDIVLTMDEDGNVTTGDLVVNTVVADGAYPGEIFVALKPKDDAHITYELEARVGDDIYVGPITSKTGSGYGTYTPSFTTKGELRKCFRYMKKVSANTLTLSATEAEVTADGTTEVTVSENTGGGALTGSSSDESVATVSIEGNTITITGVAEGTATITIRSAATENYASASQTISVTVTASSSSVPTGALSGQFTVGMNGTTPVKVYFSKGNLQYNKSTSTWSFMEHQYDIVETLNQNVGDNYASQDVVSLFGWGTSGKTISNYGSAYQPYATSTTKTDYGPSGKYNLTDTYADGDWGVNMGSGWYTLSKNEWEYLFKTRTNAASKFGYATVAEKHGIIIVPDDFTDPMKNNDSGAFVGSTTTGWTANVYSAENWSAMETSGCVFLPAAGRRYGNPVDGTSVEDVGSYGYYWSSTALMTGYAYNVYCDSGHVRVDGNTLERGFSVRLVRPVE